MSIIRLKPDLATPDYSNSHKSKGASYDDSFSSNPNRSIMWELEKSVLHDFINLIQPDTVIDFACGTGRITGMLQELLPKSDLTGVDISDSMLQVARCKFPNIRFEQLDGREALRTLGAERADLVTAFRFFPNADPALREAAADQIAALVRPGGWVILNNHRNFWSVPYVLRRAKPRSKAPGALNAEMVNLFKVRDFSVVQRRSLGLWLTDGAIPILPQVGLKALEVLNLNAASKYHSMGSNTIWLLRKGSG